MKRIVWGVLFVLSMTSLSCSEIRQYAGIVREGRISRQYLDVLNQWTRERTVYAEFETMARIAATERSGEFNEAYLKEQDRIHLSSKAEQKARETLTSGNSGNDLEYFFYAYVPDGKWNDFARANSIWKVFLTLGEEKTVLPLELREITNITPVTRGFFPYITPYGKFYSIRFPVSVPGKDGPPRTLVFTSVLGRMELRWPGE